MKNMPANPKANPAQPKKPVDRGYQPKPSHLDPSKMQRPGGNPARNPQKKP